LINANDLTSNLLVIVATILILFGSSSSTLALDATRTATAIRRSKSEVNMFLGVETDDERRNVNDLLANTGNDVSLSTEPVLLRECKNSPNVPLPDQNTSVMNTLSETALEHLSLKPPLQEILDLQSQHVIETHATLIEHTDTD
jgi:hypothetical protein